MTQFYQITLEKAISDYKLGKLTTFGLVDYYIRIKFAPGWKIAIDPRQAIKELGITIHQFRRAIAKIRETISITLKTTTQLVGEMPADKSVTANVNRDTPRINQVTSGVNDVTPSANCNPQTTNKTNTSSDPPDNRSNIDHISLSELDQNSGQKELKANSVETPRRRKRSEPASAKDARERRPRQAQGNARQDSQKLIVLPQEEREKFLEFAFQKVDELPKRPTLPKKWIAANLDDLYSEWKKSSAPVVQKASKDKQFAEWYELMSKLGHVTGQRVENGVQLVRMIGGGWIEYERKAKSWTLEYLRKCVAGR
ncbi:MAG: hypothetical protein QNJ55_27235 [Xenococcus sp. MO_188.B8]|nr:hypothetical protein [Xenococcus sp. MO_188.B8]